MPARGVQEVGRPISSLPQRKLRSHPDISRYLASLCDLFRSQKNVKKKYAMQQLVLFFFHSNALLLSLMLMEL